MKQSLESADVISQGSLLVEAALLLSLRHPNIIQGLGLCCDRYDRRLAEKLMSTIAFSRAALTGALFPTIDHRLPLMLVMEYAAQGNLKTLLRNMRSELVREGQQEALTAQKLAWALQVRWGRATSKLGMRPPALVAAHCNMTTRVAGHLGARVPEPAAGRAP